MLYNRALRALGVTLVPVAVVLAGVGYSLLLVWLGPEFAHNSVWPLRLLLVGWIFRSASQMPRYVLSAYGRANWVARYNAVEVLPYVVLTWQMIAHHGATGAAAVWATRVLLETMVLFWLANRASGVRFAPFSMKTGTLFTVAVFLLLTGTLAEVRAVDSTGLVLASSAAMGVCAILFAFRLVFSEDERERITSAIFRSFGRA